MNEAPDPIETLCVRKCCINEQDVCLGCFRTLDEICQWYDADEAAKLEIRANAAERQRLLAEDPLRNDLKSVAAANK